MPKASKKRSTSFNEDHKLLYGLTVTSRCPDTKKITSVRCRFCHTFGREDKKREGKQKTRESIDRESILVGSPKWKRNPTDVVKHFKPPFRTDNYVSHLSCHETQWKIYQKCTREEKLTFFDKQVKKFGNTLPSHFNNSEDEMYCHIDKDIVEVIIGDMLFDCEDDQECESKERALSVFKRSDEDGNYVVRLKNLAQFRLCVSYVAASLSFNQVVRTFQATKQLEGLGYLGSITMPKVIAYVRILVAISLQTLKDVLANVWCYSVAFDGSTYQHSSYLDIRIRVFDSTQIKNLHVIALPMFDRHTGDYMYQLFNKLFNVLDPSWRNKLIGVTTDGARSMTGCDRGVVTKIQNESIQEGFYRIWCALHQLDIVVQKSVTKSYHDGFYKTLTAFIGYFRRQQNLIQQMKAKIPLVGDTRWLSLGGVSSWICRNREELQNYLVGKDQDNEIQRMPSADWWIYLAVVETVMKETNISFAATQGLATLIREQEASLSKLQRTLLEMIGGRGTGNANEDNETVGENIYSRCGFYVEKGDVIAMVKDCGIYYERLFLDSTNEEQDTIWKKIAKFVFSIVVGIQKIEQQNSQSSGTALPPVMPYDLVHLRSYEFNAILMEQQKRLNNPDLLEKLQEEHRCLISSNRSDEALRNAIENSKDATSFEDGWSCMGVDRYKELKGFCGGLATVFPGTASVESDFSIVNYEKNDYRSALTNLSLEGILHSKQFSKMD